MKRALSKYKILPLPAKAGVWFTICNSFQKACVFLSIPLFTRMMSAAEYGRVSLYNAWIQLLSVFVTFNLFLGGFNNGMLKYESDRKGYVSSSRA